MKAAQMVFEGHIENGMVVLGAPLPLPDGTPVRVEPIAAPSFWQSLSLDDLARQQRVSAPNTVEELLDGWPAEDRDDDFEEAFVRWRQQELDERG
jgi:hypothetical protein